MKKLAKGFTLIELMIVVAIIGILAAIAIPNFVKYQLRSKFSEGTTNLEGLRKAEEALRQGERKVTVAGTLNANYRPGQYWNLALSTLPVANCATPSSEKCVWDADELAQAQALDWQVEGATYFQYAVTIDGCADPAGSSESGTCFSAGAIADIDGDTTNGEVGLVRLALDGTTTAGDPPLTANWANIATTGGSCTDSAGNTIYSMPCVVTGPDVF